MTGKRRHLPVRAWPLWLADEFEDRSVLIIIFMTAFVVAGLVFLVPLAASRKPFPSERIEGQIVGMGFIDIKGRGAVPEASVEVEGHTVRIEMPARLDCRVGDKVALDRPVTPKGYFVTLAPTPRPCTNSTPLP